MNDENNINLNQSNTNHVNKIDEYFRCKHDISTLRQELKEYKSQLNEYVELQELERKTKELREKIKDEETVQAILEKITRERERMELMKELIRIEMLETAQTEVKFKNRKLKIVNVLKELPSEEKAKKKKTNNNK